MLTPCKGSCYTLSLSLCSTRSYLYISITFSNLLVTHVTWSIGPCTYMYVLIIPRLLSLSTRHRTVQFMSRQYQSETETGYGEMLQIQRGFFCVNSCIKFVISLVMNHNFQDSCRKCIARKILGNHRKYDVVFYQSSVN